MIPDGVKTFYFFAKYRLYKRDAISYYRKLQEQQRLSTDELEHLNWEKRKKLLRHAYENVLYYRSKFKSIGLHPEDIAHPDDYCKVPLLTRKDIRENFGRIISKGAGPKELYLSSTGGSTGEPLKVMLDKRVPEHPFGWLIRSWWGVGCGLNEAIVRRLEDIGTTARFVKDALWWPARKIRLDASSMKPQDIENFLRKFNKAHPVILWGYAGAIDHVAFFAEQTSINPAAPKAVSVTSSPISEIQRNRIERVFHAPVYDQYGCCEVPWLAAQCRQKQGLHIFHGARLIEFTDDSGHPKAVGEVGNIVITDLENYGFPFIRYLVGDMGRSLPGRCRCGINLPLMDKVKGRQTDLVRLPNGTCLSGDYLTTIFDDFPDAVKAFQVRQKTDYSIKLRYIPGPDREKCSAATKKVHDKLLEKTGFQVQITMEPTDFIPHDRGKLRYIISELA